MKLSPAKFNRFMNHIGQRCSWRRAYDCPCINPHSGAALHNCEFCGGKGQTWADPVEGVAGLAGHRVQREWAQFGIWESGDLVVTIPESSPLYAMGQFDRVTMLNATDRFDLTLTRGQNDTLNFPVAAVERVFWLDENDDVVEGVIPTIAADGSVTWPWTPQDLFAGGEEGTLYDPSDLSTLFQDAAGTTAVQNDGDPVGLMLDLSGNDNHAGQTTAAARPVYRTDGTRHWLETDGVDDALVTTPVAALGEQWSAAAAARSTAAATAIVSGFSTDTEFQDDFGAVSANTDYILLASRDADSVEGWLNGVSDGATATSGTPLSPGSDLLTLFDGVAGRFYGGVVVSGRVFSADERRQVDNYLAGLAGLDLGPIEPPADTVYSISGTKRSDFFCWGPFPSNRNMHQGARLPKKIVLRRWDLFGR